MLPGDQLSEGRQRYTEVDAWNVEDAPNLLGCVRLCALSRISVAFP